MPFFGRYIEVIPNARIVWTNEESGEGGAVTTVTFEERDGATLVAMHDLYPSKEALDEGIASGSTNGAGESFVRSIHDCLLLNFYGPTSETLLDIPADLVPGLVRVRTRDDSARDDDRHR